MRRTHNRALLTMSALALASTLTSAPKLKRSTTAWAAPPAGRPEGLRRHRTTGSLFEVPRTGQTGRDRASECGAHPMEVPRWETCRVCPVVPSTTGCGRRGPLAVNWARACSSTPGASRGRTANGGTRRRKRCARCARCNATACGTRCGSPSRSGYGVASPSARGAGCAPRKRSGRVCLPQLDLRRPRGGVRDAARSRRFGAAPSSAVSAPVNVSRSRTESRTPRCGCGRGRS